MTGPSDLIPGKYEGGFKVWEATGDLIQWISDSAAVVQDKVILDLGCGAGLVGIACLLAGAGRVTFHDFNETVIEYFTKANVSLNICPLDGNDKSLPNNVSFAFGDWNQFYPAEKFDLIFSSETIYDEKSYGDMISLIKRSLKPEGSALIAAKTYYFGVGGGTRSFEQFVERDKCLHPQPVKVIAAPVQREIMQLRFT